MTDRELMQQALEAMEHLHRTGDTQVFDMYAAPEIIPALRERLAQPEQEPVAWISAVTGDVTTQDMSHTVSWVPLTTPPAAQQVGGEVDEKSAKTQCLQGLEAGGEVPAQPAPMTEFEEAVAACDNTLHHAIDHWQDKASEQAALLRECRFAIDILIKKQPALAMTLCGSTTLGNLKASLHDYRVLFDDTPPAAQRKPLTLGQKQRLWSSVGDKPTLKDRVNAYGLAIEAAHGIKEKNT
jgi:hypothetical protein